MIGTRKNTIIISLFLLISIAVMSNNAGAYDDKDTHPRLTDRAARASNIENYLIQSLSWKDGFNTKLPSNSKDSIMDWLTKGSTDEDSPLCRSTNHFYDPLKDWGISYLSDVPVHDFCPAWSQNSNITWATGYLSPPPNGPKQSFPDPAHAPNTWDNARAYYYYALTEESEIIREIDFAQTFQAVGQVMHLLQDMAVPAHVRNDMLSHLEFNGFSPQDILKLNWNTMKGWINNAYELYVKNHPNLVDNADANIINASMSVFTNPRLTDFWDTNQYNGMATTANFGLAEITNMNYFSDSTIPNNLPMSFHSYPLPSIDSVNYQICPDYMPPPPKYTGTIVFTKKRKYVSRNSRGVCPPPSEAKLADHFAALTFWSQAQSYIVPDNLFISVAKLNLDDNVHDTYAKELLPRAIGYSAGLLNYFFRGTLEISAPDQCVYGLIDGAGTQEFTKLKAKVRNTTPNEAMGAGILTAVAKYKRRTNYLSDLTNDPPTAGSVEPNFSYSVSMPVDITALTGTAQEFTFNFISSPIPAGITDLYLQVVFKGTLGNEADNAIAVGFKDIGEPTHINFWNTSDKVYKDGLVSEPSLSAESITIDEYIKFSCSGGIETYLSYLPLAPGQFGRVITLSDPGQTVDIGILDVISNSSNGWQEIPPYTSIINQNGISGTNVQSFRGKKFHVITSYVSPSTKSDKDYWTANWPNVSYDAIPVTNLDW